MARVADRKRGWGKFCSKSCKAVKQESITHQYRNLLQSSDDPFIGERINQQRKDEKSYPQWLKDDLFFESVMNDVHPFSEEAVQG